MSPKSLTIHSYAAEDDCRTLARAAEIKSDKPRLAAAKKFARKQVAVHARIAGGKDAGENVSRRDANLMQGHVKVRVVGD